FLEEKDDLELTSQNVKEVITGFKKKSLTNSRGYFITVYIDQIARAHDASQGLKAAKYLETILSIVKDVHGLVKTDDTLLLVASTQGSTLTVGSGAYIDENLDGYTKTEECQSYRFLNYAFGVEKAPKFDTVPGDPEYKFPSLYFAQGTTGGPDLPIFATGTSAGLFTGVNTFPYIHHAILCATCLARNAKDIYPHCPTPTTTTPALTTTTTTTTTSTTTTSTTTVTPTVKTTTRKPQSPFWPWYFQPYPGKGPNPYANMISRNDINSPASSSNARPQPVPMNPTPRPAQQQSNNFLGNHAFSWLPFLL
ncbi:alkaline phosphatase tissue-nonspecific isozyme-like isoform X4, partial [Biomphalaria pfeifferi]